MHEVGIADSIMGITKDVARENGLTRITNITIQIGQFTAIEADALDFAFQLMTKDTPVEGAELVIEKTPLLLRCKKCEGEYSGEIDNLSCPLCGAEDYMILQGREMVVKSISGEKIG
ncbi:MAG: hydrogenase maturation nickel metallochaperone HypA [Anaerolineaceae bacterium]|nr:hydrogenase maturation nickel metallochaperone HypA [Anaerolineaceae bacterium]